MELSAACKSEACIAFTELPLDVLLHICQYLDLQSLAALSNTSRKLYAIINDEYLNFKSFSLLVTNQFSVEVQKRSLQLLSSINKYYQNYRWRKKCYDERIFLNSREKFRPWLALEDRSIYISQGRDLRLYARDENGIADRPTKSFRGHTDDISRFVVRGKQLVTSGNDGRLVCWNTETGKPKFSYTQEVGWNESVFMDWAGRILAAGYNAAGLVKFLSMDEQGFRFCRQIETQERVWSVALNDDATSCSIGSAGYRSSPLKIYDLHRGAFTLAIPEKYKVGAGVFDTVWDSPQVLISGSYDTYVRMWDLRTGQCVQAWPDPYDAAIYSLATDHHCTILAGTAHHARVTLWDKRANNCVQMYYMSQATNCGPVYCLDFDPSYMFVALESSLHVLNFTQPVGSPTYLDFRSFYHG